MIAKTAKAIWFVGSRRIEIREESVAPPGPGEITVQATRSLISAGTEMLVYRGETTTGDRLPPTSKGRFPFPVKYGYQVVGTVVDVGQGAPFSIGERVFARHPHQDVFTVPAQPTLVTRVPDGLDDESATFVNLMRVALTANLDVPVKAGELAVVLGQGIVGMLCARVARLNADTLVVADRFPGRRQLALDYGAELAVEPDQLAETVADLSGGRGADVVYEASGAPAALQLAIEIAGDHGEIVAVSLYGNHIVPLRLAPEFHFHRLRITSSQAGDQPRWDWERRTKASLRLLQRLGVRDMISASLPLSEAAKAYELVDTQPERYLGVVLDYAGHTEGVCEM